MLSDSHVESELVNGVGLGEEEAAMPGSVYAEYAKSACQLARIHVVQERDIRAPISLKHYMVILFPRSP